MKRSIPIVLCALACAAGLNAGAHGFAGKRFFPATIATDDPFVADELSLPTFSRRKLGAGEDSPAVTETVTSIDFTKRITQNLGVGFGVAYVRQRGDDGSVQKGFDNLAASVKYQFHKSDEHESIASFGIDWDIGNTGAKAIGESFSTITPAFFFGKGFGDLPESMPFLKPFAVTGSIGLAIPSRTSTTTFDDEGNASVEQHPNVAKLGLAIEYSLPYLQSFVKDVGLGAPFNRMIPIVELALEKPVNRGAGPTVGTVNPGILWAGRYVQVGAEAVIPVNSRTGGKTGVLLQLHFFIDDIFPRTLGKPVF